MEGRRLSTELLDNRQEQDILLGRAESSKSGPAEKANSAPSRTVHTSKEQIPPEQGKGAGAGRCHPLLAGYSLCIHPLTSL